MSDAAIEGIDPDVAAAVGFVLLGDVSIPAAADHVGITQWELETALERAELADLAGLNGDCDVAAEIDSLLER